MSTLEQSRQPLASHRPETDDPIAGSWRSWVKRPLLTPTTASGAAIGGFAGGAIGGGIGVVTGIVIGGIAGTLIYHLLNDHERTGSNRKRVAS